MELTAFGSASPEYFMRRPLKSVLKVGMEWAMQHSSSLHKQDCLTFSSNRNLELTINTSLVR